jgi:hypothetical protein
VQTTVNLLLPFIFIMKASEALTGLKKTWNAMKVKCCFSIERLINGLYVLELLKSAFPLQGFVSRMNDELKRIWKEGI